MCVQRTRKVGEPHEPLTFPSGRYRSSKSRRKNVQEATGGETTGGEMQVEEVKECVSR